MSASTLISLKAQLAATLGRHNLHRRMAITQVVGRTGEK